MDNNRFVPLVSLLQGVYYLVTGIWPVLSRRSFESVTGPKVDFWLVRTFGGIITAVGAALIVAGLRRKPAPESAVLAVGSAASLAASDVIYASRGRISPIYLVEAAAEFGLLGLWGLAFWLDSRKHRPSVLQFSPDS